MFACESGLVIGQEAWQRQIHYNAIQAFRSAQTPNRLRLRVPQLIMQPACIHHITFIYMEVGITSQSPETAPQQLDIHHNDTLSLGPRHGTDVHSSLPFPTRLATLSARLASAYCHITGPVLDVSYPNGSAAALNFIIVLGFISHLHPTTSRPLLGSPVKVRAHPAAGTSPMASRPPALGPMKPVLSATSEIASGLLGSRPALRPALHPIPLLVCCRSRSVI